MFHREAKQLSRENEGGERLNIKGVVPDGSPIDYQISKYLAVI